MAEWHANAKLRLHTDSTVLRLKELTRLLGSRLRFFANNICPLYDTRELPREEAARARRRAKQAAQRAGRQCEARLTIGVERTSNVRGG